MSAFQPNRKPRWITLSKVLGHCILLQLYCDFYKLIPHVGYFSYCDNWTRNSCSKSNRRSSLTRLSWSSTYQEHLIIWPELYRTFPRRNPLRKFSTTYNNYLTKIVGLYPGGSPSRNSLRPETSPGRRGGLEIVFNQQ